MNAPTAPTGRAGREPAETNPARLFDAHRHARAFYRDHVLRADGPRRYIASRGLAKITSPRDTGRPGTSGTPRPAGPSWSTTFTMLDICRPS